mmetsp:Transcript_14217/g.48940  ORF Transcript_14217/g.48940 Transcript_14217/m.48940 type:complete len:338 (-) Transcript_14217:1015-2028(-)
MSWRISFVHWPEGRDFTYGKSRSRRSRRSCADMESAASRAAATDGGSKGLIVSAPLMSDAVAENSDANVTPGFFSRTKAYSKGARLWPSRIAVPMSASARLHSANRTGSVSRDDGISRYSTAPAHWPLIRAASFRNSPDVRASSSTRVPSNSAYWTSTTRPRHCGYSLRNRSKARSLSATPDSRWQLSTPASTTLGFFAMSGCNVRSSASISRSVASPPSARRILPGSTETWRTTTMTVRPSYSTPVTPPCTDLWGMPMRRLQALRKWRAWSKAWKPTTSAPTKPVSSRDPCAMEQNNWDVGKGMWRKKTMRALRFVKASCLNMADDARSDGSSMRW